VSGDRDQHGQELRGLKNPPVSDISNQDAELKLKNAKVVGERIELCEPSPAKTSALGRPKEKKKRDVQQRKDREGKKKIMAGGTRCLLEDRAGKGASA